ncbi:GntR family transcriptional regulator [Neolewinella persica]|uniref:GntR family transcriptional regulator n=1 Tax=Neolewinella persica TaxID=70998 RepID=UPI0003A9FF39|nr:GntR family transcriptional regulator [Neolewinella persica]
MSPTLPHYRRLYQVLKQRIQDGEYLPGDLLPSENTLCNNHSLTRPTVRQSLRELAQDGFIRKVRGKGSIVQSRKIGLGLGVGIGSLDTITPGIETTASNLQTRVIEPPVVVDWPKTPAFTLNPQELGTNCIYLSRVRLVNEQPVFYAETRLPNDNLTGFMDHEFTDQSLFDLILKHHNLKITGGDQRIQAVTADGKLAELLDVTPTTPLLRLDKRYNTNRSNYRLHSSIWYNTQQYYLEGML